MNADRLDPKIVAKMHATEWQKGSTSRWYEATGAINVHDGSWLLSGLSTSGCWIQWHAHELTVTATGSSEFGNFFAYGSKTNGYSKTSLLCRLFRNEYDPKTDKRPVDFLFIPVWR